MRALALLLAGLMSVTVLSGVASASDEGPNKVWLCHFEDHHEAAQPYTDDRNGEVDGFWTLPSDENLVGDYIVRYNADTESGLNAGQIALCTGNGGEFTLVSVNAIGTEETPRGHNAQNLEVMETYPDGYKG